MPKFNFQATVRHCACCFSMSPFGKYHVKKYTRIRPVTVGGERPDVTCPPHNLNRSRGYLILSCVIELKVVT